MTFFSRSRPSPRGPEGTPRERARKRRKQRGVAIVLVLGALTILTVMLTDFQDEASAELGSALSARDSIKAEYAARSAIQLSRLLIASEPTIRKALAPLSIVMGGAPPQIPVWEFADQVLGAFNDAEGQTKFSMLASVSLEKGKKLGMEGAGFDIDILDEDSKINVNSASRDAMTQVRVAMELLGLMSPPQYEPMFTGRDGDGQYSDRATICGAIIDWVDFNQDLATCDLRTAQGGSATPEDTFYQLLDPPYFRKNAPFDSLEELHMVRGVTDDFWSTFVDPDPQDPAKRNVTVWGQGKINVNTANAQTILALICASAVPPVKVCMDPMEMAKFLSLVNLLRSFTMGAPLFNSPNGFVNTLKQTTPIGTMLKVMGLEPITFISEAETKKAISTDSKVFSLIATGHVKSGQRDTRVKIHAVVDFRGSPPPAMLLANQMQQTAATSGNAAAANALSSAAQSVTGAVNAAVGALGQQAAANGLAVPPGTQLPTGATADSDLAFLIPSPGGRIVYFRID
ncbi:MAG TPA: type II secretion system protein GspK [Polyangiaceae bacterium]|nr:type II secretion system protein GspK [Polyangiaceae bacterium]